MPSLTILEIEESINMLKSSVEELKDSYPDSESIKMNCDVRLTQLDLVYTLLKNKAMFKGE